MSSSRNGQSGFTVVEALLVVLVIVIIGAAGWFVYKHQHKNTSTSTTKPTTTSNSGDTAPKATLVKMPELGVQFTLPAGVLPDFKYVAKKADANSIGTVMVAYLGTKQLDELGCATTGVGDNAPALGFLKKTSGQYPAEPSDENASGPLVKQFSDFYISYQTRGFACFTNPSDASKDQMILDESQQLKSALTSIELIP